jgi:hypothetical protein
LAVIVFTEWWLAAEKPVEREKKEEGQSVKGKGRKQKKLEIEAAAPVGSERLTLFPFFPVPLRLRRMIAAGVVAGLLPLVHAHSFVVVMVVGGCIALAFNWRAWLPVGVCLVLLKTILGLVAASSLSRKRVGSGADHWAARGHMVSSAS